METKNIDLTRFQDKNLQLASTTNKIGFGQVLADNRRNYLNELQLFAAHFNTIPHLFVEINIDCTKANLWFLENYKSEIKDVHFTKRTYKKKARMQS